jgi:hypothetical protein
MSWRVQRECVSPHVRKGKIDELKGFKNSGSKAEDWQLSTSTEARPRPAGTGVADLRGL